MLDFTRAATAPDTAAPPPEAAGLPWLVEAHRMMVAGHAGLQGRRELLHLLGRLNSHAPWTVPWCGLFVDHCLRTGLPGVRTPFLPARARPWRRWGVEVEPQMGALMHLWHYHPALPLGHVAFYWAEDEEAYHVLGGNQGHRVCVQRYPKDRLRGARWPAGVPQRGVRRREPAEAALPFDAAA